MAPDHNDADCVIDEPYLLALNVGLRRHQGGYWADPSWAKDLAKHRGYLTNLTLFCPYASVPPEAGWVRLEEEGLRIVGYPAPRTLLHFLAASPAIVARLAQEVRRARVVHSAVAGWPVPLGWLAVPLARLLRRKIVLIVESTFWRLAAGERAGAVRVMTAHLWEAAARACLARADYAAYTQAEYQRSLPAPRAGGGRLIQASWVEAEDCLPDPAAFTAWDAKATTRPRFLFAARLLKAKGTDVLAEAVARLAAWDAEVEIHILGEGPERASLAAAAEAGAWARSHVRLIDPVPYDRAFLKMVAGYHALLVPGLTDEQPRIVYDGYSQAVPAIGSATAGLAACIGDGTTGRLVPAGDAEALADAIVAAAADPAALRGWGMAGLARVRTLTHERLHRDRCRDLRAMLDRRG